MTINGLDVLLFQFGSSPCPMSGLNVASWPAYTFLRHQVRRSVNPISWIIFHNLLWSTQSDVLLKFSCFFYGPVYVGNLISGSSAFSKSSLNIWKFLVHVLLKPNLENFEHYFTSMWHECNCAVVWTFALPFFGIGMKTDLFQSCGHCWVFQICWHIECHTLTASFF